MKNKKHLISIITVILLCALLTACASDNSAEQVAVTTDLIQTSSVPLIDTHPSDHSGIDRQLASEIKTAYCRFTCDKNYGGEQRFSPSDMYVLRYEGKIGDCHIVMMGGDEICYTQAMRGVDVAGYSIVFGDGQPVYAYHNGNFYTIGEAYDAGLLSKENVYQIGTLFDAEFEARNSGAESKVIKDIIYHSDRGGMQAAVEPFYSDDAYIYNFPTIRSYFVIVYYTDGTEENVKEALEGGRIQITDLDRYGIRYYAEPKLIESITDISKRDQLDTADALEYFYRDDTYCYYFSSIKSHYIIVRYKDGTEQNVKEALESGKIKISDLDWFGIKYNKEPLENFHE